MVVSQFQNSKEIMGKILNSNSDLTRNEIFGKFVLSLPIEMRKDGLAEELTQKYSVICEHKIASAPEIPHAQKTLEKLKNFRKSIFVSSATPLTYLTRILQLREVTKLFDGIYGAPSSKIKHIDQILAITKKNPKNILYIGDSEADRVSAKKSGCDFIGINYNENRFTKMPKVLIRDFVNFFEYIAA